MRKGRLPHDPDVLAQAPVHLFGAVMPPPALDRTPVNFVPTLGGNDTYSNCTVVSLQNMILYRSALNGFQTYIDPAIALQFFADCAGNPADLLAVNGLVYLDVVNRQATHGFDTGHDLLFGIPGVVSLRRNSLALAMATLGGVELGITLHELDEENFSNGKPFDTAADMGAVTGGHAIVGLDYTGLSDTDTVNVATWGRIVPATWRWLASALDEAHALSYVQLKGA